MIDLLFDVELDLLTRSQDSSYILRDRSQRQIPSFRFETRDMGVPEPLRNKRENIAKPNSTNALGGVSEKPLCQGGSGSPLQHT